MNSMTRRDFIQASAAGAAALSQFPAVVHAAEPDRKIKLGLIGCGWYGMVDVNAAFKAGNVEVIGICDVDGDHLKVSADQIEKLQDKRPQTFTKYEDLLSMAGLEAIIIGTPPHWHALQLIAALNHNLDVYCEKPLSYDIREGRAMVDAVKKSNRIVQIGFQRRQSPAFQAVRRRIQDGTPGRIICAEANIFYTAGTNDASPQAPPAALDWEAWCGPAPKIPYSPQVGHKSWRLEKTTGHGHLVDWGIHLIDATRVMLGEGAPKTVSASGGLYGLKDKITTPDVLTAHFDFASCPLTWRHRIWGAEEYTPTVSNGVFFYGEKETIFVTDDRWEVVPRGKNKDRQVNEAKADTGLAHMVEFLNAVRTRQPASCQIEDGYASTTSVKLAMISYDTGCKVTWDSQKEQIVGNPAASALLKREYRQPWKHPFA